MNTLDLLLNASLEETKTPTKEVKLKRLSDQVGSDVVFTLQAINLDKLEELRESNDKGFNVQVVLHGVKDPYLKSQKLLEKYNAVTPVELVKKLLLAGEIDELYHEISKLSGYGRDTIEEIKKK